MGRLKQCAEGDGIAEGKADLRSDGSRTALAVTDRTRGLRYVPGLDGLRALAVTGVVLYHADVSWIPGGFLGVDVFFVLSGFLITSLLLQEFAQTGAVRFRAFYARRARRLLPALFLMLAAVAVASGIFYRAEAAGVRQDLPAALTYWSNWGYILRHQSYFASFGPPPALLHLWSLAVEEQFYIVWPLVAVSVLVLVRRWRKTHSSHPSGRLVLGIVAIVGALASTAWMAWLSIRGGYPNALESANAVSRAYFGTDTHAMTLLTGAALACLWRGDRIQSALTPLGRRLLGTSGAVAAAALVVVMCRVGFMSTLLYRGGFLVVAMITAVLIAATTCVQTVPARFFSLAPLRWIGQRSYGIYLWHWPIDQVTRPTVGSATYETLNLILRCTLTVGIAELSYRFVEMPVRNGALARLWSRRLSGSASVRSRLVAAVAAAVTVTSVLSVSAVSLASAPVPSAANVLGAGIPDSLSADGNGAGPDGSAQGLASLGPEWSSGPVRLVGAGPSTMPPADGSRPPVAPARTSMSVTPPFTHPSSPPPTIRAVAPGSHPAVVVEEQIRPTPIIRGSVTIVGDSVVLGASFGLWRDIPGAHIDASVGRQAAGVLGRLEALKKEAALAPVVVLHMGTNGIVTYQQLHEMLAMLAGCKRVIVVNTHVPRPWQDYANDVIAREVPLFHNAVLANWSAASAGHSNYFVSDGVHLTTQGIHAFAALIARAIAG